MSRRRAHRRSQRGLTFIESVVVVGIVSGAVLTFAYALGTEQKVSNDYNERQQMWLALTGFSETLKELSNKSGAWPTVTCPAVSSPPPASINYATAPVSNARGYFEKLDELMPGALDKFHAEGMTFSISAIKYWKGGPAIPATSVPPTTVVGAFNGACTDPDIGAQELTINVCPGNSTYDGSVCVNGDGDEIPAKVRTTTIVLRRLPS